MEKELPKKEKKIERSEEPIEEEKVLSMRRILIALLIVLVLVGGILWGIFQGLNLIQTKTTALSNTPPPEDVELPTEEAVASWVSNTQQEVTNLSLKEKIASSSAVQDRLDALLQLQAKDLGVEDIFCKFFCKK
jgi:cytoskeletal protein RodZ